jgi:hypothetical protein
VWCRQCPFLRLLRHAKLLTINIFLIFSVSLHLSIALQTFRPWPLFSFLILYTGGKDSLDGGSARRKAATCTQNNRINAHRHPCLEWDTNPRSQGSSGGRRFTTQTARPLIGNFHLRHTEYVSDISCYLLRKCRNDPNTGPVTDKIVYFAIPYFRVLNVFVYAF